MLRANVVVSVTPPRHAKTRVEAYAGIPRLAAENGDRVHRSVGRCDLREALSLVCTSLVKYHRGKAGVSRRVATAEAMASRRVAQNESESRTLMEQAFLKRMACALWAPQASGAAETYFGGRLVV